MKLVVSMPTRGRPQQLIETVRRNLASLSRPDSLLMVQVDEDDEPTIQAVKAWVPTDRRAMFTVAPRADTVAAKWNRARQVEADVYTCLGDDDPLIGEGADDKILRMAELFPDGIGMVYGHLANASFSGVISFTKKFCDILGYIQPEHFPFWFCDHWTDDIGRITGRIAFADVRTDQSRPGKTMELREPAWWATWFDATYMIRRQEAFKVIDQLNDPPWRKEVQKSFAPLVEFRSKWINENVRQNARNLESWSALGINDERYLRVKNKAIEALPAALEMLPTHEANVYRNLLTPPSTIINLQKAFG